MVTLKGQPKKRARLVRKGDLIIRRSAWNYNPTASEIRAPSSYLVTVTVSVSLTVMGFFPSAKAVEDIFAEPGIAV